MPDLDRCLQRRLNIDLSAFLGLARPSRLSRLRPVSGVEGAVDDRVLIIRDLAHSAASDAVGGTSRGAI